MLKCCLIDAPVSGNAYRWRWVRRGPGCERLLHGLNSPTAAGQGYAIKSFKDAELHYCTTHRELAAVIYRLLQAQVLQSFSLGISIRAGPTMQHSHLLWTPHMTA